MRLDQIAYKEISVRYSIEQLIMQPNSIRLAFEDHSYCFHFIRKILNPKNLAIALFYERLMRFMGRHYGSRRIRINYRKEVAYQFTCQIYSSNLLLSTNVYLASSIRSLCVYLCMNVDGAPKRPLPSSRLSNTRSHNKS